LYDIGDNPKSTRAIPRVEYPDPMRAGPHTHRVWSLNQLKGYL